MATAAASSASEIIDFGGGGPTVPRARLCAFATGQSRLLPAHESWLKQNVMPAIGGGRPIYIRLWGYASKVGNASFNQRLSVERATAVKKFLEQQTRSTISFVEVGGYGESRSMGAENDNSPVYRAVDVYIYPTSNPPPAPTAPPEMPSGSKSNMYMGLGVKMGGIIIGGTQTIEGRLYSSAEYEDAFNIEARLWTLGPGLGAGINVVFLLAFGAEKSSQFKGVKFDGWDFSVSIGGRWGDVAKGIKRMPVLARIAKMLKDGGKSAAMLKALTKLSPDEWEKMSELSKAVREAAGVDSDSKTPTISAFDIPLAGAALEVSLYKWWGTVTALY